MATITKRGDTFRIKVSPGYDMNNKQIIKSTTYKSPKGTTPKKAEKLAQQLAFDFENRCKDYMIRVTPAFLYLPPKKYRLRSSRRLSVILMRYAAYLKVYTHVNVQELLDAINKI